jgi:hypothetical protein
MSDYFDHVERQIVRRVESGMPRSSRLPITLGHLATAAAVLVVLAVAGVFLVARGSSGGTPAPTSGPGVTVVLTAVPGAPPALIERSVQILSKRLTAVVPQVTVSSAGNQIIVTAARAPAAARSEIVTLAAPGELAVYDWEGDVLAPNGKTVGSQLPSPDPAVLEISQGSGSTPPGELGAGCVPLQQALALADRLGAGKPRRTEYVGRLKLRVPIGYVVLEAAGPNAGPPTDGFFVARVGEVVAGDEVTNPQASTDPNTRGPP